MDLESAKRFLVEREEVDKAARTFLGRLAAHRSTAEQEREATPEERYKALNLRLNALPIATTGSYSETDLVRVPLGDGLMLQVSGQVNVAFDRSEDPTKQHHGSLKATWYYGGDDSGEKSRNVLATESLDAVHVDERLRGQGPLGDRDPSLDEVERRLGLLEQSFTEVESALVTQP